MIPKIIAPRRDGRSSFERLEEYLTVERKPGSTRETIERGPVVLSDNIFSQETAAREMRAAAAQNALVEHPIMHFMVAWEPGEKPTETQWKQSAERMIQALGFGEHQYLIAAHDDKEHFHVHVMLNRVHPETAKAHNPRLSQLTLHRLARELEHEFEWTEADGLYRWDRQRNEPVRNTKAELSQIRDKRERSSGKKPGQMAKQDHFRDEPSLKAFASKQPAQTLRKLLDRETDWQQVHLALARHGLTIHKAEKGGYTVGVEGTEIRVKASDVFRFAFSGREARARTEAKLGEYRPANLGKTFEPRVVDYNRTSTAQQTSRNMAAFPAAHRIASDRAGRPPSLSRMPTLDDLPRLADLQPIAPVEVDRMAIREIAPGTPGYRTGVRLVVQSGNQPGTAQSPVSNRTEMTTAERRQQWLDREAEAGRQRRQQRTEERARERLELKQEFQAARAGEKAALHRHTLSAQVRRLELLAQDKRNRLQIRSADGPGQVKKALRSRADMELVCARLKLRAELAEERSGIPKTTYEQWVERKAEMGDKRAVAQMRGWRYQDSRNMREVEPKDRTAAGELRPKAVPEPTRSRAIDWQELAHERMRKLREQPAFREVLEGLGWKADRTTAHVAYSMGGVVKLRDQGNKITVLVAERDPTRVALQMAIHKYGTLIDAKGTAAWQDQLIAAAVQDNVRVVFTDPELQRRLLAARQAGREQAKPEGPDLTRARERFHRFDDQLMHRYGPGLDPAQADRLIAGSMAKAGFSEQEIAGALRELSRLGRETKRVPEEDHCRKVAATAVGKVHEVQGVTQQPRHRGHSME